MRPAQPDRDLAEVDLGFLTGPMRLQHEHLGRPASGLSLDLRVADRDVGTDDLVLVDQPVEDPLDGVALFAWCIRPTGMISSTISLNGPSFDGRGGASSVAWVAPKSVP